MRVLKKMIDYNLIYIVLYRLALDWHYFTLICPRFGPAFADNRTNESLILSWISLLFFYHLVKKWAIIKNENLSSIVVLILFMISFVPFTTCIYAEMATRGFVIYNIIYWGVLIVCLIFSYNVSAKINLIFKVKTITKKRIFVFVGLMTMILIVYVSWRYAHFRLITNLMDVYSIRKEALSYNYSTILKYLLSWTAAINPILIGACFIKGKRLMTVACLAVQMLNFGIDGRKGIFFMPFIVIVFLLFYKNDNVKKLKNLIIFGICMLCISGIVEYKMLDSSYISDFGIRRVMIMPNQLGEFYYDFFTKNPPDFFRSSFLRQLGIQSPYVSNGFNGFTYIIANIYFGKPDMNCNNGLSSDAIANLGSIGCFIMPMVLVLILKLLDKSSKKLDSRLLIIVAVYVSYNLLSTTLTTCLLTHGLVVLMLVLPLMEDWRRIQCNKNT